MNVEKRIADCNILTNDEIQEARRVISLTGVRLADVILCLSVAISVISFFTSLMTLGWSISVFVFIISILIAFLSKRFLDKRIGCLGLSPYSNIGSMYSEISGEGDSDIELINNLKSYRDNSPTVRNYLKAVGASGRDLLVIEAEAIEEFYEKEKVKNRVEDLYVGSSGKCTD